MSVRNERSKKRKADAISDEEPDHIMAPPPHLPASCLGAILNFLPYSDVRTCMLAGRAMAVGAARHVDGYVVMYADRITKSMQKAIEETDRRRVIQKSHNLEYGITPQGIRKTIHDITERVKETVNKDEFIKSEGNLPKDELVKLISDLQSQMKVAAKKLEFEKAALLRDQIVDLRKVLTD